VHERNRQTDKHDYYGNTALCSIVHCAVNRPTLPKMKVHFQSETETKTKIARN